MILATQYWRKSCVALALALQILSAIAVLPILSQTLFNATSVGPKWSTNEFKIFLLRPQPNAGQNLINQLVVKWMSAQPEDGRHVELITVEFWWICTMTKYCNDFTRKSIRN